MRPKSVLRQYGGKETLAIPIVSFSAHVLLISCAKTLIGNIQKVLDFGKIVKKSLEKQNMLAWQYNAVGVSDAITMGGEGKQSSCYTIITYTTRPYSMSWRRNLLLCHPHHGKEDHI